MIQNLEQTWRWYGPNDPVSLSDVKPNALNNMNKGIFPLKDGNDT